MIAGTDLEVFCVARVYSDVLQVTINCHHVSDASTAAAFGCWARAQMNGTGIPEAGGIEVADRFRSSVTFDTETVLGGSSIVGSESAELLARVLCERIAARSKGPASSAREVLLSLSLPADIRTLDMTLLRQIAAIVTETITGKHD